MSNEEMNGSLATVNVNHGDVLSRCFGSGDEKYFVSKARDTIPDFVKISTSRLMPSSKFIAQA